MKNLYQHSIDLKKICIDNTDKDSFSQKTHEFALQRI